MKVSPAFARAVMGLRAHPAPFSEFRTALEELARDLAVECVQASPETVHVAQGRAQAIAALIRSIDAAPQTLEKLRSIRE